MGEGLIKELTMQTLDNKIVKIENCKIVEITNETDTNIYDTFNNEEKYVSRNNFTLSLEMSVRCKRKRFIKLLMSRGLQKREAIEIANYSLRNYGFYNQMLFMFL